MRAARLIATAAVGVSLAATAIPAHADEPPIDPPAVCTFSDAKVTPSTVILGISKVKTVKVTATGTGCEDNDYGYLYFGDIDADSWFQSSDADPTKWSGEVHFDPEYLTNADTGKLWGQVGFELGGTQHLGAGLTLKRASRIDVGEMPKKIKKNKKFYFGASLDLANWSGGYYTANEGKKVKLQTHTKGHKYKTIKTLTSMRGQNGGFLPATVRLKKSTWFRWVYAGSSKASSAMGYAGFVKVK